jgi:hypothetical protein
MDTNDYKDTLTLAKHGQQHLTQLIRDAERLVDYFRVIEQYETERARARAEKASKALLTAVFGTPAFSEAQVEAANKATAEEIEESMKRLQDSVVVKVFETTYEPLPFDKKHPRWDERENWVIANRPQGKAEWDRLQREWMQAYYSPTYVKKVTEKNTK